MLAVLESLVFVTGEDGISFDRICEVLNVSKDEAYNLLEQLKREYEDDIHGFSLELLGNNYKFVTKVSNKEFLKRLVEVEQNDFLSQSALETLAIIAYNEPITRIDVDSIRGVNSSYVIRRLVLKDFIKEVGKSDLPGRPILYATTSKFLDYFGLSTKEELPKIDFETDISGEETDLFETKYKEE